MMMKIAGIEVKSNRYEVVEEMKRSVLTWLDAIGEDAAETAANKAPVDTGLLKNSITYAIAGEAPNITVYKADTTQEVGTYVGTAPEADIPTVYIGTNVEYAIYQEFGTSRGVTGKHFIKFGATAHLDEYKQMLVDILKE